jgi:hydroxymethylbilane synthase
VKLRLATRGSRLAWGQSSLVAEQLRALGHEVELVRIVTHGDVTTAPLASLGGAGVFVGAVRAAVLAGEADFAVHSFKDLPTAPADGLVLAAVPEREDPADALCTADGRTLAELPSGARVGTGSPRRAAQLLALRPDLVVVELRGNVETRLARTQSDLDAVVLAAAGLNRLGLADRISERFDPAAFVPAPAQGALALECRAGDAEVRDALAALDHAPTRLATIAEREVLAGLAAGCAAPVAAHAVVSGGRLELAARVVATDGSRILKFATSPESTDETGARAAGSLAARRLLADGAAELVDLGASRSGPLAGRRILLPTRTPAGLVERLTAAGAEAIEVLVTAQEALPLEAFRAAATAGFDWLVVTSAATVDVLAEGGFGPATLRPPGARIAAVGPVTAEALTAVGLTADLVAHPGGGTALAAGFPSGPGTVLLPGAADPSAQPASGLAAKGWDVRAVPVYRTMARDLPAEVVADWRAGRFDAFVVTAGSVARAAVASCGLPGPGVIAIGEPSAAASRDAGLDVLAVSATPDAAGLWLAVIEALA